MSFLAPLFFLGLAALAVPVLIHLTQRERTRVVEFPSLMFLRKIPYESVKKRRIRDWLLLALRLAALGLIVLAFTRPFVRGSPLAAAPGGAREIVVLLDRSYSMGFGDTWARAQQRAAEALADVTPADRVSLVLFADDAEVVLRATPDRSRAVAEINAAAPGAGATRYGPAIKLAGSMLAESRLPRRVVVLVSDFQRAGWQPDGMLRLPGGATLLPVPVPPGDGVNLAATPVSLRRAPFERQERVVVTAGVLNRSATAVPGVSLHLEVDGRVVQTATVDVGASQSASATFAPVAVPARNTRATVRLAGNPSGLPDVDALARDNVFHFVLSPAAPVSVIVLGHGGGAEAGLYLGRALAIGESPRFEAAPHTVDTLGAEALARARVVVLNDVAVPEPVAARLVAFVDGGGGLLLAAGPRASWPSSRMAWLPAALDGPVDRTRGVAAKLSTIDYGHVVFEPFRAPRSGDFTTARFYGYRALTPATDATVLARFDTGEPAVVEKPAGRGRVILFASTLDLGWSDLVLKPVFLPFVHQLGRRLSGYREQPAWLTVGQVLDVDAAEAAAGATTPRSGDPNGSPPRAILSPSGQRRDLAPSSASSGPSVSSAPSVSSVSSVSSVAPASSAALELHEQGFYEIRSGSSVIVAASNVSLAESNLDPLDPGDMVLAVSGPGGGSQGAGSDVLSDEAQELSQRVWWYLLFAGILLLIGETVLAGRLSRAVR